MNPSLDSLLRGQTYASNEESKTLFRDALLTELTFHYDNNPDYRRFCENKTFNPHNFAGGLDEIPSLSVHVFKTLGGRLRSVPDDSIKVVLQSSATRGRPSTVLVDRITAKRQASAMVNVMSSVLGKSRKPFLIVDVDPASRHAAILGARGAAIRGYLNFASSARYLMTSDGAGNLILDQGETDAALGSGLPSEPVVVFGFTYVLYSLLIRPLRANSVSFRLPPGSKVIHIGGWKKLEGEKVDKATFNHETATLFGLNETDVIDIYGFSEQMGLNYPDCPAGWKHVPSFAELVVRDPSSRQPVADGVSGLLEFLTPVPHSYPGNAVLTDDVGVAAHGQCDCGLQGTRFRVLGRAKKAEIRGCGDVMADRVMMARATEPAKERENQGYGLHFHTGEEQEIPEIVESLRRNQAWLRSQRTDHLIALIAKAAERWAAPDFPLEHLRKRGLSFLGQWCQEATLSALSDFSLHGRRGHLDGFLPVDGNRQRSLRAMPRGLVCHWLSGNVTLLGMLVLVQSILCRNANLIKVAHTDDGALVTLLRTFEDVSVPLPGGGELSGRDLLKSIAVVYFDRSDDKRAEEMSTAADVRIAWGGAAAVQAISELPKAWSAQDIIFGPRLSLMAIGADALQSERDLRRLARLAATDSSVFDQTACASPHTIFVEKGGAYSSVEFAARLAEEMEKALVRIPTGNDPISRASDIAAARATAEFTGHVWSGDADSWTVLHDEEDGLATPTYGRVITVRPIDDLMLLADKVSADIQTVGLAALGLRRQAVAESLMVRGVDRCPNIGMMTNFESPWDGMIVMDRLVRWTSLG